MILQKPEESRTACFVKPISSNEIIDICPFRFFFLRKTFLVACGCPNFQGEGVKLVKDQAKKVEEMYKKRD